MKVAEMRFNDGRVLTWQWVDEAPEFPEYLAVPTEDATWLSLLPAVEDEAAPPAGCVRFKRTDEVHGDARVYAEDPL